MNINENTIKTISDSFLKMLIENNVSYKEALEILRLTTTRLNDVEINTSSLKIL